MVVSLTRLARRRKVRRGARRARLPSRVFPEYAGPRAVGALASLAVDIGAVAYAIRRGVAVMEMGKDSLRIINPEAVRLGVGGFVRP